LDEKVHEELVDQVTLLEVDAGEVVISEGQPAAEADKFYLIQDGNVQVHVRFAGSWSTALIHFFVWCMLQFTLLSLSNVLLSRSSNKAATVQWPKNCRGATASANWRCSTARPGKPTSWPKPPVLCGCSTATPTAFV